MIRRAIVLAAVAAAAVWVVVMLAQDDGTPDDRLPVVRLADAASFVPVDENGDPGCGVSVVAPDPEPCIAARQAIAYVVLGNLVNSTQLAAWRKANPGEWARLNAYMTSGGTSTPGMLTPMGGALVGAAQAYFYARGRAPLAWPTPNPTLDPKRADKKPPSSPSGLTVG